MRKVLNPFNDRTNEPEFAGEIPSLKLFESERVFAFLDIQPLSQGHAVRLPARSPVGI